MRVPLRASFGAVTQVCLCVCVKVALLFFQCVCVCWAVFMHIHVGACILRTQGGECVFSVFVQVLLIPGIQQGV